MIRFLLRLPAVCLTTIIIRDSGGGMAAQILGGLIACFLMEALINAL